MDWKYLLLSFEGRINRKPYWIGVLAILVFSFLVAFSLGFALNLLDASDSAGVISLLVSAAVFYPSLAISVKRLHDRSRPGWWIALPFGLSLLTTAGRETGWTGTPDAPNELGLVLGLASLIVGIWFLIELGVLKGTQGPNRFGPDPLGATQADASM